MPVQIQLRNGTSAAWTAANPLLAAGEAGVEIDTLKIKVGDGATLWNALAYATVPAAPLSGAGSPEGVVTASPGETYLDTTADGFWAKKTGVGNTGWIQLIA